jgi:hypothetical protein
MTVFRISVAISTVLLGVGSLVSSESAIGTKAQYPTAANDESDL